MKRTLKTITSALWVMFEYIFSVGFLVVPIGVLFVGMDYFLDLKLDMFSEQFSLLRVILFVWFVIVSTAFVWQKWGKELKKLF